MSRKLERQIARNQAKQGNGVDVAALKAEAYDIVCLIDRARMRLEQLNRAIAEGSQAQPVPPPLAPEPSGE